MSIENIIGGLKKAQEEKNLLKEKEDKENELNKIREKVKELEILKSKIEIINNSIGFESDYQKSVGMHGYKQTINEEKEKIEEKIDTLIKNNKETLSNIGVNNKEELVENDLFAEDEETLEYKKRNEDIDALKVSDSVLLKKLKELGIEIDKGVDNFNYGMLKKPIEEKLQSIEKELLQNLTKLPERQNEVIEILSKNLEKSIPEISFKKSPNNSFLPTFYIDNGSKGEIVLYDEEDKDGKVDVKNLDKKSLIPKEIEALEKTYGKDLVKEVLLKNYETKIESGYKESAFDYFAKQKRVSKTLEEVSPGKGYEVYKLLKTFETNKSNFNKAFEEKQKELKEKGIDLEKKISKSLGSSYKIFSQLLDPDYFPFELKLLEEVMKNPNVYPPKLNFGKLKEYIEVREKQIKEFIDSIKGLNSVEDVEEFTKENNMVSLFDTMHKTQRDFSNLTKIDSSLEESFKKFESYSEAKNYCTREQEKINNIKQKVLDVIKTNIEEVLEKKE
ncbi:MAG: hypothetical protein WC898_01470 [Candidatus Paceibacterota bacterium]|jgi:hypothetical protein